MKQNIYNMLDNIHLVPLSPGYRINDFNCEIEEYSNYLHINSFDYHEQNVSKTHLLVNKQNGDIIAYMVLVADSIKLSGDEKLEHRIDSIPFGAFPAIKIGKLAVCKDYKIKFENIGSLMIELVRGFAYDMNELGIACKFITIDADVEHNPTVIQFYHKNGFKLNEKYKRKNNTVSMRLDIFNDEKEYEKTGTED